MTTLRNLTKLAAFGLLSVGLAAGASGGNDECNGRQGHCGHGGIGGLVQHASGGAESGGPGGHASRRGALHGICAYG